MASDTRPRSPIRPWHVQVVILIVVLVAVFFNVKVVSIADATAASPDAFDPASFAADNYASEIVPQIEKDAVPLASLLTDLAAGADEAEFGNSSGTASSFSFPVTFTGVAGTPAAGVVPIAIDGVPAGVTVQLQVGPALNGTALRDVTGTISFDQFTNQLEYQQVGTELNDQVKATVLDSLDVASLAGKTVTVTGAYTRVNPALVSVVPVKLEVSP
jgi:predicted lipoprotein